jgi:RimJ/RimL family protein N-acetyltransferase
MAWETTGDVRVFLDTAGAFMRERPADHTSLLTVAETVALHGPNTFGDEAPQFGWWASGGRIGAVFLHTPPFPVLLGPAPLEAAPALLGALADRPSTGLNGPVELVQAVAAGCDRPARERRRERLYRLGELIDPPPPPGRTVVAGAAHRARLLGWYDAFAAEIGEARRDWSPMVDERLSHGGLHVWEAPDGEPVSFAGISRQIAGMMRIAPVYTPPEQRGRGYGAALTAAVGHAARAAGAKEILLFADLANPTSNRIYQRVGFEPVGDRLFVEFVS